MNFERDEQRWSWTGDTVFEEEVNIERCRLSTESEKTDNTVTVNDVVAFLFPSNITNSNNDETRNDLEIRTVTNKTEINKDDRRKRKIKAYKKKNAGSKKPPSCLQLHRAAKASADNTYDFKPICRYCRSKGKRWNHEVNGRGVCAERYLFYLGIKSESS